MPNEKNEAKVKAVEWQDGPCGQPGHKSNLESIKPCPRCGGSGGHPAYDPCSACDGSGTADLKGVTFYCQTCVDGANVGAATYSSDLATIAAARDAILEGGAMHMPTYAASHIEKAGLVVECGKPALAPVEDGVKVEFADDDTEKLLLETAMREAKKSADSIGFNSYIRNSSDAMSAYEAGYIIGHRHASRQALSEKAAAEARVEKLEMALDEFGGIYADKRRELEVAESALSSLRAATAEGENEAIALLMRIVPKDAFKPEPRDEGKAWHQAIADARAWLASRASLGGEVKG